MARRQHESLLGAFLVLVVAACGSPAVTPPATPLAVGVPAAPSPQRESHPAPPVCSEGQECLKQGMSALASGDERARVMLARACDAGATDGCLELGRAYVHGKGGAVDATKAREAFARSCAGPTYSTDGCAWWLRVAEAPIDPVAAANAAEIGCSIHGATADNREVRGDACVSLAEALIERGRDDGGLRAYGQACKLGSVAACDTVTKAEAAKVTATNAARGPDDVAGANLNMDSMNVDGLALAKITCRTEGSGLGGLFGGMTIGVGFKAKKSQLDACASKGIVDTRVKWTGARGRMTNIRATGKDIVVNKCVERALTGAVSTTTGVCAATVTHGRK